MGLVAAVVDVLGAALPGLFGGTPPAVALTVDRAALTVDALPGAGDAEPRLVDGVDVLPFDGEGPYELSQAPAAGPRQVRLQGDQGRVPLRDDEIRWDADEPRRFTLVLDGRDDAEIIAEIIAGITAVRVTYSVVVVRTRLLFADSVHIGLGGADQEALERAEALVLAVLALEGRRIAEASRDEHLDGDVVATVTTESVDVRGTAAEDSGRVLAVRARRELTADRVLRDDEGQPITRIHGPGRPPRPDRPVDVPIDVDA